MRRAAKRDDNEAPIVTALQSAGWTVVRVSDAGAPDLLVAKFGVLWLMEVKGPNGTLTPKQKESFTKLATAGVLVQVVRSPFEALEVVGASWEKDDLTGHRWFAQNGAYLCLKCWLPENGLHAKDCPTRKALAKPPKVTSAYRAEQQRKAWVEQVMPKSVRHEPVEMASADHLAAAIELRASRGVEGELQPLPKKLRPKPSGA